MTIREIRKLKAETKITKRKFLGSSPSLKAISWEVFQSFHSGAAYGQVRLAWGSSFVVLHTLDMSANSTGFHEYLEKLDKLIDALKTFVPLLGTKNQAAFREWLNPIESSATGSVAYHYDVSGKDTIIYFEIASCSEKIRIYPGQFPRAQWRNMAKCLDAIRVELVNHRASFVRLQRQIESVNIEHTNKQVA